MLHGTGGEAEELVAAFAAWAAGERVNQAAAARSRERWLRQQATETATWLGTLVDLSEAGAGVTVLAGGRRLTGRLAAVGPDFCVLASAGGSATIVALAHVRGVSVGAGSGAAGGSMGSAGSAAGGSVARGSAAGSTAGGSAGSAAGGSAAASGSRPGLEHPVGAAGATGDRAPSLRLRLADALAALAAERSPVRLLVAGGEVVAGDLTAVGTDVLTLRVPGGRTHVPLAAVETCSPRR